MEYSKIPTPNSQLPASKANPLVVIVGPTGSGKSALALDIAVKFNGEIICADSRTIYEHLDIGTAKPSKADQKRVPHHMLDIIEPGEQYSAAQFKTTAVQLINEIKGRDKLPILVGGSGLYIDAILYDFSFNELPDMNERTRLAHLSLEELQAEIFQKGLPMPNNSKNPRHLIRMIETNGAAVERKSIRLDALVYGMLVDRVLLRDKLAHRAEQMLANGLIDETVSVAERYGWDAPGLQAPAYKALKEYIIGSSTKHDALQQFVRSDLQLAKRQLTWFKRNNSIHWLSNSGEIVSLLTTKLNKS